MKNNLKELRERYGLKQAAFARELGIKNQASISEWETGRKGLSVENAIQIAAYFGVTVGCVVGTEPIPDSFPSAGLPVLHVQQPKPPQIKEAEPEPQEKLPFTQAQIAYLDERDARLKADIADAVVDRLREDSSSSSELGGA